MRKTQKKYRLNKEKFESFVVGSLGWVVAACETVVIGMFVVMMLNGCF